MVDEGVDKHIVETLRSQKHQVTYIAEADPGVTDDVVLVTANQKNALLITSDKDFGEMVYRQGSLFNGVLLLRLFGLTAQRKADLVVGALQKHADEFTHAFSVLSPGLLRIRRKT